MSCSICFSKINNEHKLECGHVFHKQCIKMDKYESFPIQNVISNLVLINLLN